MGFSFELVADYLSDTKLVRDRIAYNRDIRWDNPLDTNQFIGIKIMKITKHIQAIADKNELTKWETEVLQTLWNKRKKPRVITLCLIKVSNGGMNRQFKVATIFEKEIVSITRLVAKVSGERHNRDSDTVSIGGCGMDMGFALMNTFYAYLMPDNSKESSSFLAVQRRNEI